MKRWESLNYGVMRTYPVAVSNQLKGSLDYLLQNHQTFLVIEAKNEDLERGFLQLAVELIALDQWIESDQAILPGAISTGNIWQFGQFVRQSRVVTNSLIARGGVAYLICDRTCCSESPVIATISATDIPA